MKSENQAHLSFDLALIGIAAILTCFGMLEIYAASSMKAVAYFNDEYVFLRKQFIGAFLGFFAIVLIRYVPFKLIERMTIPLLLFSILLLAAILFPGVYTKVKGASRWVSLFGFQFQPAELAKLALILFLAKNLARRQSDLSQFGVVFTNLFIFGIIAVFLMLQPDFGSTALLGAILFFMLFVAGIARRFIFYLLTGAIFSIVLAVALAPYRMQRFISFLNPWAVVDKGGFQIIQSYLAFQNGGFWGLGLGESRQKLFFLPEAHSDFILAVLGEETGLLGVLLVCLCFLSIVLLGYQITLRQATPYKQFLAFGLTSLIGVQALFNIGVVMGLLPTKGIPLPLVSSGASSLLVFLVVIGILARLGKEVANQPFHTAQKP
jgi:cell division protein FtsW